MIQSGEYYLIWFGYLPWAKNPFYRPAWHSLPLRPKLEDVPRHDTHYNGVVAKAMRVVARLSESEAYDDLRPCWLVYMLPAYTMIILAAVEVDLIDHWPWDDYRAGILSDLDGLKKLAKVQTVYAITNNPNPIVEVQA